MIIAVTLLSVCCLFNFSCVGRATYCLVDAIKNKDIDRLCKFGRNPFICFTLFSWITEIGLCLIFILHYLYNPIFIIVLFVVLYIIVVLVSFTIAFLMIRKGKRPKIHKNKY